MDGSSAAENPVPPPRRGSGMRGHFASGALESASHILGSTSAGIFAVGLVGPYIAALMDSKSMNPKDILGVAGLALVLSVTAGLGAVILRGLGRCLGREGSEATESVP